MLSYDNHEFWYHVTKQQTKQKAADLQGKYFVLSTV